MDNKEVEWKFQQVITGRTQEELTEADLVSAIEFDHTGNFVAFGNKGGKVTLFERKGPNSEYKFYTDFQSHESEFDYLKSLEIEEKINKIKWWKSRSNPHFLLTTNDKTIKLWKVYEKKIKNVWKPSTSEPLRVPQVVVSDLAVQSVPRRIFANAHAYHINSISPNSDGETFLSSDDLRINLWNFGINKESFTIVDIKPENMEDLSEVITSAEFHPSHCNLFIYSSSKGGIKLGDMRNAALCDTSAKVFEEQPPAGAKSFFSEIISSISDIKFTPDGRYIISRDYLTMKVWDLNMENKPIKTISIHDHIKSKLCDLYENDCIFDKFECSPSPSGEFLATGSYHHHFYLHNTKNNQAFFGEANKKKLPPKAVSGGGSQIAGRRKGIDVNVDSMDFGKKVLHVAWNPIAEQNQVAVAASNNIFLYSTT
eukprot:TRINITY_DN7767_c0_g1_i1.p1 TRINITY_DN7767_c0_g1~~TRINITY_DN7767_c0_g1_i1.p1  ORF type:complete len:426 (-),score=127.55 TRINITY_DN7767_c0_g1_i1:148-1425(-)